VFVAFARHLEAAYTELWMERIAVMKTIKLDCQVVLTEGDFWDLYLAATQPQGAGIFGRSVKALHAALEEGEAGWPGECELKVVNTQRLKVLRGGSFYEQLSKVAGSAGRVRFNLE
jgi:hypothetical protein